MTRTERTAEKTLGTIVADFGQARLVEINKRRLRLTGGTRKERLEAMEWVSLFMPEAVISRD